MKTLRACRLGIRAWIIILVSYLVIIFLIAALVNLPRSAGECSLFPSRGCVITAMFKQPPYVPSWEFTDDEITARVAFKEILKTPPAQSKTPKIAFMFLTPVSLPFEKLWEKFFHVRLSSFLTISLLFVALFMHVVPELVSSNSIGCTCMYHLSVFRSILLRTYVQFRFTCIKSSNLVV